jgi:hypothetical protein
MRDWTLDRGLGTRVRSSDQSATRNPQSNSPSLPALPAFRRRHSQRDLERPDRQDATHDDRDEDEGLPGPRVETASETEERLPRIPTLVTGARGVREVGFGDVRVPAWDGGARIENAVPGAGAVRRWFDGSDLVLGALVPRTAARYQLLVAAWTFFERASQVVNTAAPDSATRAGRLGRAEGTFLTETNAPPLSLSQGDRGLRAAVLR